MNLYEITETTKLIQILRQIHDQNNAVKSKYKYTFYFLFI